MSGTLQAELTSEKGAPVLRMRVIQVVMWMLLLFFAWLAWFSLNAGAPLVTIAHGMLIALCVNCIMYLKRWHGTWRIFSGAVTFRSHSGSLIVIRSATMFEVTDERWRLVVRGGNATIVIPIGILATGYDARALAVFKMQVISLLELHLNDETREAGAGA